MALIAGLDLDDTCDHPVMGTLSLRWVLTHCIRELAQHTGHAEILVEQILAGAASCTTWPTAGGEPAGTA